MSQQLSIAYRPSYAGHEAWQRLLELLRTGVEHLGRKEVAYEIDVSGSALSDALNERDRKRWAAEWLLVVLDALRQRGDDVARDLCVQIADIVAAIAGVGGPVALSPEEEVAALKRELAAFGVAGKAAIDRVKKRGRR